MRIKITASNPEDVTVESLFEPTQHVFTVDKKGTSSVLHLGPTPLLIVDGYNLAHSGSFDRHRENRPHRVAEAFMAYLRKAVMGLNPVKVVVTWDTGRDPRRVKIYPEYKRGPRKELTAEDTVIEGARRKELEADVAFLRTSVLQMLGVDQMIGAGAVEADDLIFSIVQDYRANPRFSSAVILSTDEDLYQMLTPATNVTLGQTGVNVFQLSLRDLTISRNDWDTGIRLPSKLRDGHWLKKNRGWWPADHVFLKAAIGDTSDNIPGVVGFGKGGGGELMRAYGSAENALANLLNHKEQGTLVKCVKKKKFRNLVLDGSLEILKRNIELMQLKLPLKIPILQQGVCPEGLAATQLLDVAAQVLEEHDTLPWGQMPQMRWLNTFAEYSSRRARHSDIRKAAKASPVITTAMLEGARGKG